MEKRIIAVCDDEPAYASRLCEYLKKYAHDEWEIRLYSSVQMLADGSDGIRIDTLIISENYKEYITSISCDSLIVLSDKKDTLDTYRYDSAKKIAGKIFASSENTVYRKKEKDLNNIKISVKNKVQEKLLETGSRDDNSTLKIIDNYITSSSELSYAEKNALRNSVFYSIRGLDVLEELLADDNVTEIMVNGESSIFYEKDGRLIKSSKKFDSKEQLNDIIQKIVSYANRTVNLRTPIVDARLENGSRVNVVMQPVSLDGTALTIRRFKDIPLSAETLINTGCVTEEMMTLLRKLVYSGYNILISGSTGSGKTTFLNILTGYIPKDERIITIEDSAELKITEIDNLVRMETRNAASDGSGEIQIRDLIKAALRMRPDRIIVGEVRGAEAIDMLQSFSVGQDGSMSTIHANSSEDALYRLEMLLMMGNVNMPLNALRRQISIGVDIIVHLGRLKDKTRKVLEIREVTGFDNENILTHLLYRYERGGFAKCGDIKNTYKLERALQL